MAAPQVSGSQNPRRVRQGQLLWEADTVGVDTEEVEEIVAGPWSWLYDGRTVAEADRMDYEAERLMIRPRWYPIYAVLFGKVTNPGSDPGYIWLQGNVAGEVYQLGSGNIDTKVAGIQVVSANLAGMTDIQVMKNSKIGSSPAGIARLRLMIYSVAPESRPPELAEPPEVNS